MVGCDCMQVDTERRSQWLGVIDASVEVLQQQLALHPDTGLLADFLVYDHAQKKYKPSQGKILERDSDGDFGYNACRSVSHVNLQSQRTQHCQSCVKLLMVQILFMYMKCYNACRCAVCYPAC